MGPRDVIGNVTISYLGVFWNVDEFLSPAVFTILRSKHIGVTSLTFKGEVTSSATWLFDSSHAISYWWSFGTKPLL